MKKIFILTDQFKFMDAFLNIFMVTCIMYIPLPTKRNTPNL